MAIPKIAGKNGTCFSFEFFPPRNDEASRQLFAAVHEIQDLQPDFISVTCGAGGSTRGITHDLVVKIRKELTCTIVPHVSCMDTGRDEIRHILSRYYTEGIRNFMALRGDTPRHRKGHCMPDGGFRHAHELVSFIKEIYPDTCIGVAGYPEGHPETPNRIMEIEYLAQKEAAGADFICTQMFFCNNDFYDFRERCRLAGINAPIIAGIMPITSLSNMKRMAELAQGMRYPAKLLKALYRAENQAYVEKVGVHWATEQVMDLINNGIDGIHFYTLNRSQATKSIYASLGVTSSSGLYR